MNLKEKWAEICNEYIDKFCQKHEYYLEFWISDEPGTIACLGDLFVSMDDIRYDIDNNIPKDNFDKWYWKSVDRAEMGLKYMNYQSFCNGAPDPIPVDQMEKIIKAKDNLESAKKMFEQTIKDYQKA